MRTTLSLLILFTLAICASSMSNTIKYRNRLPQNCQNGLNISSVAYPNWFWNEQQCMVCSQESCYRCNAFNDCAECQEGQKLELVSSNSTRRYCLPCGMTGNGIAECCYMNVNVTNFEQGYDVTNLRHMHATRCVGTLAGETKRWNFYGHVCMTIQWCDAYTQYGRCLRCFPGYYLTEDQMCKACNPPMWNDQYVYDIQNEFELIIKRTDETNVPSVSESKYCTQCFGERQCTKCGIHWDMTNWGMSRGSYLATNVFRSTFDKNVGRNPSFCIPCNQGCECTGPDNLCERCVQRTSDDALRWYMDPLKHMCFPCNMACVPSDENNKINCCEKCVWDEYIQGPRCIECKTSIAESNHDGLMGVVSFDDWLKPVNNTEFKFKVCYRCDRQNTFTGKSTFNLPSWTAGTNETAEVVENRNQKITKERLNRDVPGHPDCGFCEARTINPTVKQRKADGTISFSQSVTDPDWALRFIDCVTCQNGHEKVFFGGNIDKQDMKTGLTLEDSDATTLKTLTFGATSTETYTFEYRFERTECRKCQELVRWQDRVLNQFNGTAGDETSNRYRYVRRCERTSDKTNRYFVTQCGTRAQEDYISEGTSGTATQQAMEENSQRGPYLPYNWRSTASPFTGMVKQLFNPDPAFVPSDRGGVGLLSWFLVGVDNTTVSRTCIRNKWQCLQIKKQGVLPITDADEPKCLSCLVEWGYVMTTKQHCRKCDPLEAGEIPKGCSACIANPATEKADELLCSNCYNNQDGLVSNITNQEIFFTNYFFNSTERKCYDCNEGCRDCGDSRKLCNKCQTNWGFKPNSTIECHRCADKNCLNCDGNTKVCLTCKPGFRTVALATSQTTTSNVTEVYCESCEKGCLSCSGDRKTCTSCERSGYYLDGGKCKIKRNGCVQWEMNGGRCLMCQYGYRLNTDDGYCYKCFSNTNGFIDCPSACSNNYVSSNVRQDKNTPVSSVTRTSNAGSTVSSRILSLLDADE